MDVLFNYYMLTMSKALHNRMSDIIIYQLTLTPRTKIRLKHFQRLNDLNINNIWIWNVGSCFFRAPQLRTDLLLAADIARKYKKGRLESANLERCQAVIKNRPFRGSFFNSNPTDRSTVQFDFELLAAACHTYLRRSVSSNISERYIWANRTGTLSRNALYIILL